MKYKTRSAIGSDSICCDKSKFMNVISPNSSFFRSLFVSLAELLELTLVSRQSACKIKKHPD